MGNEHIAYKRVKINWWVFILFGGFHVHMIFTYIRQWSTEPVDEVGLFVLSFTSLIYLFIGRFKVIVDDNFFVFRSDLWVPVRIPIFMIDNVSIEQATPMNVYFPGNKTMRFQFHFFALYAVKIQLKSGKIYEINIKEAEIIKKEIEKRMIKIQMP